MRSRAVTPEDFAAGELRLIEAAIASVSSQEPFYELPTEVAGDLLLGWHWSLKKRGVSRRQAQVALHEHLEEITARLRMKLFPLRTRGLNEPRAAVLLHLSLILGVDRVLEMADLWKALAKQDYELAHDALMLSEWPAKVGADHHSRRRALALARMLRTGELPPPV